MGRRTIALAMLAIAVLILPASAQAQQADVIRGRVIGPDSLPVEGVLVTATTLTGNVSRSARTNRDGRYTITHPAAEGDYMISFASLGYAARRFELKRMADEEVLIADARMSRINTLETVRVAAPRDRVDRNAVAPDVGGTEQQVGAQALPAADLGDLAAMAATLPGVQLVPGENGDPNGFSVLGLGADQNSTTLNGMNFGGSNLPRDAAVSTSVATSPYDVSRGGFSGGQLNVRSRAGSNFVARGMSLNLDAPQLQWTDRAAQSLGQQYSNLSLGGMASGPIRPNQLFYNLSWQLGRRGNDFQSLLNTDPLGLQAAGVSQDSVTRLLGLLQTAGVPSSTSAIPGSRHMDQGSIFAGFDLAPSNSQTGQALSLSVNGSWNRQNPLFAQATMLPASTGERTSWNGGVQARHTGYFKATILTESSFGASGQQSESSPYLDLPAGRVRVNSSFADGTSGVQTLSFGGSPSLGTTQANTSLAALNQLSWFSANNKHRIKLASELRRDGYIQEQAQNALGTFAFNSLAELQANRPAMYTRQLSAVESRGAQLIGGMSLGDAWRPTRDVQVQYGLRLDGNRFLDEPVLNPAVRTAFGVANNSVPNSLYLSPRVGFSWTYGSASQIASFAGAARAPRAVIRGGLGVFRNTPATQLITSPIDNTGLPGSLQQLACVGAATPVPNWAAYASNSANAPTQCADGTAGTVFANTAPNVSLLAPDFVPPRSMRSNLQWSGTSLKNRLSTTLEATYSRNLNQSSTVDLNFDQTARFTVAAEDGRPVFVDPASIVPATGAIASGAGRVSPLFARVTETKSDLRSESRQVSLRVSPASFNTHYSWSLAYVFASVREQTRGFGFGGNTASNPLDVSWSRSPFDSRHQVTYSLGYNFFDAIRIDWFGQLRSGTPFTPMIASDVNGDGWANDRAFVIRPEAMSGTTVAADIQSLLSNGSSAARACLRTQLGALAARNSCQGPWTTNATLSLSFNPAKVRMPQRASISFQLSNPLGAADLLVNGSENPRGWGQFATPDANLLYVRGFDPVTRSYSYEVNRRFGATDPARSAFRVPATLTAMVRIDVGPTRERQQLAQQLNRGRTTEGDRLPEQMLRAMFTGGGLPNPLATILRQQDSLKLTSAQADSIATMNRWYATRSDSIWAPVARYLGALPEQYDKDDAYSRWIGARRASVDLLMRIGPDVRRLLTPEQYRKLPALIASHLEPRYLASIRSGTVTFTGGRGFTPPGGQGGGGAVFVGAGGGGGGGGNVIIMRH